MNKYKVGDAVTEVRTGRAGVVLCISEVDTYDVLFNDGYSNCFDKDRLTLTKPSLATLTKGMIIENTNGIKAKILDVRGDIFVMSCWNDFESAGSIYTKTEFTKNGWKVVGEEEKKCGGKCDNCGDKCCNQ